MSNETTAAQQIWQAAKLRNRVDKALMGYPLPTCALVLSDLLYGVTAKVSEDPLYELVKLFSGIHEAKQEKPRIVQP